MSELSDRTHLLQAAACGASDFIIKPFSPRSLSLKLKKLISGQEFRLNKRVATFEAFDLKIIFNEQRIYTAKLLDISVGGCSVITELFHKGGCVYDNAELYFSLDNGHSFSIPAELIRTERDPECEDSAKKELIAAFQFNELDIIQQTKIQSFISDLNNY